jgi:LacI family transcriptional regulator
LVATRRTTLKDVAHAAGVSITTASVVLNDKRDGIRVPESTRDRVLRAARELGYVPNEMARGLRSRRSAAIGFITAEVTTTPFAVAMLAAAQEEAARRDNLLIIINVSRDAGADVVGRALDSLLRHQVSDIVYASMYHRVLEPLPTLPEGTVFVNARAASGAYRSIVPAEREAARNAVRELLEHGHRRIAYLDDDTGTEASRLRLLGYSDALTEYDVGPDKRLHLQASPTVTGGLAGGGDLIDLAAGQRPTAVFCFNDRMAMGLFRAARHRGLSLPDDLSVVGFDDQEFIASELEPPLTTMRLPHREMGRMAIETVLDPDPDTTWARQGPDATRVALVDCPIVRRSSVAAGPHA